MLELDLKRSWRYTACPFYSTDKFTCQSVRHTLEKDFNFFGNISINYPCFKCQILTRTQLSTKTAAYMIVSRSPPRVFTIRPHPAFRHATMTQWCYVTGQVGHWLFVSIQINPSLFWTDNVIKAQRGHKVYSSQAWCVEQGGQRSKWTPLTERVSSQILTQSSYE